MSRLRTSFAALSVATLLALTGCSGQDDPAAADATSAPESAPAESTAGESITVGDITGTVLVSDGGYSL